MTEDVGYIEVTRLMDRFHAGIVEQAWCWVRAWLHINRWQDGIGAVGTNREIEINAEKLFTSKELLIWALVRIALSKNDWLDLETFLWDMLPLCGERYAHGYWCNYRWQVPFADPQRAAKAQDQVERSRLYWMTNQGNFFANMLMVTFAHFGLVETGRHGAKSASSLCFRLTPLGRAVFAAPEHVNAVSVSESKCLTIQPNYDVLLFLNEANAESAWLLPRFAKRTSAPDNRVQTFALSRDSVYFALEAGLTLEQIRNFLHRHSKTGVPDNVERTLMEWGQKREALVVQSDLALAIHPNEIGAGAKNSRAIGARFRLFDAKARRTTEPAAVLLYPINQRLLAAGRTGQHPGLTGSRQHRNGSAHAVRRPS